MYIIADSSSTRTEWVLVEGRKIVSRAITRGLNPYLLTRREISHCIRLELPEEFFKRRWEHIFFYGAGCSNPEKNKILENSLIAQFRTPVTINSDLLGAARGMFVRSKGLACILGTGSNSCVYDGEKILYNIRPGGYILGDEGSACDFGKNFVNDCLKGLAPKDLIEEFYSYFSLTPDNIHDEIYTGTYPNETLARYSSFLIPNQKHPYVENLVKSRYREFFIRSISQYKDYKELSIAFVGRNAVNYEELLRSVAEEFGVKIDNITDRSIPGLIEYHSAEFSSSIS